MVAENTYSDFKLASDLPAWTDLQGLYESKGKKLSVKDEFKKDESRYSKFSKTFVNYDGSKILFDFSKNLVDDEIMGKLAY